MNANKPLFFTIKLILILLFVISVLATIGHYMPTPDLEMVIKQSIPPGPEWYGAQKDLYNKYSTVTFLHIVPAFALTLLVPILLNDKVRSRFPIVHRWSGRLFLLLSSVIVVTAVFISFKFPFGRSGEALATLVISGTFTLCLVYAFISIRRRDIKAHQKWMIRALAAGFSPATMRIFFATIQSTYDISAKEIFTLTMWIGFILNLVIAELWIRRKWSSRHKTPDTNIASRSNDL